DPVHVAVKIELEQVPRIVGRLPSPTVGTRMPKSCLRKIDRIPVCINRPHRISAVDIVLDARRKEAWLVPADAGLKVAAIRHKRIVHSTAKGAINSCPVSKRHPGPAVRLVRSPGYRFALSGLRAVASSQKKIVPCLQLWARGSPHSSLPSPSRSRGMARRQGAAWIAPG